LVWCGGTLVGVPKAYEVLRFRVRVRVRVRVRMSIGTSMMDATL